MPLALVGIAQSSTTAGNDATLATDGDSHRTCSHTLMEIGAWWAGDLGREVRFIHLFPDSNTGMDYIVVPILHFPCIISMEYTYATPGWLENNAIHGINTIYQYVCQHI